jgi:pimeloyl-ACP methyl ester carboxylesterase
MPDRDIRYCTTEDGIRIAYCIEGDGPATIIAMPVAFESFSLDHMMPVYQEFYRELGAGRRLVRFDQRGTGLSDRVAEFPEDYRETDLAAVARSVGADKYAIWAPTTSGPSAIGFVAGNADLVSHLVL